MKLGRVLDVATRFSAARRRCMQFVPLSYSWVKEDPIIGDGERLRILHSRYPTKESRTTAQDKERRGYWMSIIHAKMK